MDHSKLLLKFYTSFRNHDPQGMVDCYHEQISFTDPAFGTLKKDKAGDMWKMLLERGGDNLDITFSDIQTSGDTGQAKWTAHYTFGPKKRPVVNKINSNFIFQENKIIQHIDDFNLWAWSRQALGLPGLFLGWSPFLKHKIQKQSNGLLNKYQSHE